jgi:hypothetical protein
LAAVVRPELLTGAGDPYPGLTLEHLGSRPAPQAPATASEPAARRPRSSVTRRILTRALRPGEIEHAVRTQNGDDVSEVAVGRLEAEGQLVNRAQTLAAERHPVRMSRRSRNSWPPSSPVLATAPEPVGPAPPRRQSCGSRPCHSRAKGALDVVPGGAGARRRQGNCGCPCEHRPACGTACPCLTLVNCCS